MLGAGCWAFETLESSGVHMASPEPITSGDSKVIKILKFIVGCFGLNSVF